MKHEQVHRQSLIFDDVHSLGAAVGFDLDFRPLSAGSSTVRSTIFQSGPVSVVDLCLQRGFHQLGQPPADRITVGIPRYGVTRWCNRPYTENSILPFNQPGSIDVVSTGNFRAWTLSLDREAVEKLAEEQKLQGMNLLHNKHRGCEVRDGEANRHLRHTLTATIANRVPHDTDTNTEICLLLMQAADGNEDSRPTKVSNPDRVLGAAIDWINAHITDAPSVTELSSAIEVPVRTINRAFHRKFDLGPKAYINRARLTQVRSALITSPHDESITDIANRYGFWHMGQFAGEYRRLFGELPSATRARSQPGRSKMRSTAAPR